MSWLDLKMSEKRRTMVKKRLTLCMRDCLKDKEVDYEKVRKTDGTTALLADNMTASSRKKGS